MLVFLEKVRLSSMFLKALGSLGYVYLSHDKNAMMTTRIQINRHLAVKCAALSELVLTEGQTFRNLAVRG